MDIVGIVAAFKAVVVQRSEEEETSGMDKHRLGFAEELLSDAMWKLARADVHLKRLDNPLRVQFDGADDSTTEGGNENTD